MARVTQIDLFRSGNASTARLSRIRTKETDPGLLPDIETYTDSAGVVWVSPNTGGASTWDTPDPGWRGPAWRLPAQTAIPDELDLNNDEPGHWVWGPSRDMPLADYAAALEKVNVLFRKL